MNMNRLNVGLRALIAAMTLTIVPGVLMARDPGRGVGAPGPGVTPGVGAPGPGVAPGVGAPGPGVAPGVGAPGPGAKPGVGAPGVGVADPGLNQPGVAGNVGGVSRRSVRR